MAWAFAPLNDKCVVDEKDIDIYHERHYITWDDKQGCYRRICAAHYDAVHQRPYERRKSSDSIIHSTIPTDPQPKLGDITIPKETP